jgi:phosphomannomutase
MDRRMPRTGSRPRETATDGGWTIGVFEHSTVVRDHLSSLLHRAGAEVVRLARSDAFVPVDTEGYSDAIFAPRHEWIRINQLDAIVSSDGDGDRPLVIDRNGDFIRGDVIGLLTARRLGADTVVTPVTSNSGIEASGAFARVERTKVGSPYVIHSMDEAAHDGGVVVGFEANGGTLLGTDVMVGERMLTRLPTRDAILPILCVLATAAEEGPLANVVAGLPLRAAQSDRLQDVAIDRAAELVARLAAEPPFAREFFSGIGEVESVSTVDGPRFTLKGGDIVHYRPSGNAPELRCYVEGATPARAETLLRWGLDAASKVVRR